MTKKEKDALYYSTNFKHLYLRRRQVHSLTDWNNEFHKYRTLFIKKSSAINNKYAGTNKLKTEMDILIASFPNISIPKKQQRLNVHTTGLAHNSKGKLAMDESYISSDTATLEYHPLK
ncbi:hypothetical protein C1646_776999 [Rhizophagus diaphanus]|nr:hypothetical protein C1646_776999 [Rhizophagus diaphanus] [Rhizophagus sp. MUCL 43196]